MGNAIPSMKLTYFDIQGAAEKVRLALVVQGIEFKDDRIKFADWPELKKKTKFGQLPILTLDGKEEIAQSGAMLRYVARLKSKTLYPEGLVEQLRVEEVLGLCDDFAKAWTPCLYMGMKPQTFGYPEDFNKTDEGKALVEKLRKGFLADQLPKFMGYFGNFLGNNKFLVGNQLTIADLTLLPALARFTSGTMDYVPADSLDAYPKIKDWMARVMAIPAIAAWYKPKPKEEKKEEKQAAAKVEGTILGMGNPLLDIAADVEQDILDKYELKMGNAILCEDKHKPLYEELVKNYTVKYIAGGATQNTIRVAQWMLQAANSTSYVGCVGQDEYGKQLKDCATADGVAVHYLEDEKTPTGTCAALIMEKERSLVANLSAANNYKKDHYDSEPIQAVVKAAQIVYSAGFFLTVSPDTIQAVGAHCAESNKLFCMNLSAPFITQFYTDPLMAAIPFVDIMFGNESEAAAFGEKQEYADKSVKNVALEISKMDKVNKGRSRMVVITQGADATVVAQDGEVTEYAVPKLAPEAIVDVNGAGDSFVGGFLAGMLKGKSVQECVDAGHYAASVILGVSGCVLEGKPDAKFC